MQALTCGQVILTLIVTAVGGEFMMKGGPS